MPPSPEDTWLWRKFLEVSRVVHPTTSLVPHPNHLRTYSEKHHDLEPIFNPIGGLNWARTLSSDGKGADASDDDTPQSRPARSIYTTPPPCAITRTESLHRERPHKHEWRMTRCQIGNERRLPCRDEVPIGEHSLLFSTFHSFLIPSTRPQTSAGALSIGQK